MLSQVTRVYGFDVIIAGDKKNQRVMLDDKDIQKLEEVLSTKDDLRQLRIEMNQNFAKVITLEKFSQFKDEVKQDFDGLREAIQSLVVSVDKLVKTVVDIHDEYVMMTGKMDRHEKWIQQIAEKLGMKLGY